MFYKPASPSALADVIPFFKDGEFKLFYLKDHRDFEGHGEGVDWNLLTTKDFVHFIDHGAVIPRGKADEQDLYVFTGSVFEWQGKYYCFYTGHNPHFFPSEVRPQQAILLAVSTDLLHWEKQTDFYLRAPDFLEPHDFRDPFVYRDESSGKFKMLLAARKPHGAYRRRGLTAVAVSDDLLNWTVEEKPFFDPCQYYTHECPDLFSMGEWWYLIFSEFTDQVCTRYRMAKSPDGPWITPACDLFDNRNFYAAKTASDGTKRYLFGWNPTTVGEKDRAVWQWGGSLAVHELVQNPDGTLAVKCPDTVAGAYTQKRPIVVTEYTGYAETQKGKEGALSVRVGKNEDIFSLACFGLTPDRCLLEFSFTVSDARKECGVFLRSDDLFDNGYFLKFQPMNNRIVFDRWPRQVAERHCWIESERYCEFEKTNCVRIFLEGSLLTAYVNDKVAFSTRMYDYPTGKFGVYASCETVFENITVKERKE